MTFDVIDQVAPSGSSGSSDSSERGMLFGPFVVLAPPDVSSDPPGSFVPSD